MKLNRCLIPNLLLLIIGLAASPISGWAAEAPPVAEGPLVEILATDPTALVGSSSGAFTLIRSGPTDADLAVSLSISGTASNGVDYIKLNSVTNIPAGYLAADIILEPILDLLKRGNKTVVITLQTNAAYRLAGHTKATLTRRKLPCL